MREYVEVVRRILEGGKVDYRGTTVAVQDFKLAVKPQRQVPIYLAAVGPRMARLAGEIADGALVTMNTLPQLKKLVDIATTTAVTRGRMLDIAAYSLSFVSEDQEENVRTAKRVLAMYCSAPFYNKVFAAAGYEKEAGEIARLWASSDKEAAYDLVTEGMIQDFAALGAEEAVRMVRRYREAGVTLPVISLVHVEDFEQYVTRLFSQLAA
jgi:alkanesulfonate monooxygenase SsuD/methylene tetrahydromethanopterin reductase-like flavin-dependent oxidoreductase (luciferase family)